MKPSSRSTKWKMYWLHIGKNVWRWTASMQGQKNTKFNVYTRFGTRVSSLVLGCGPAVELHRFELQVFLLCDVWAVRLNYQWESSALWDAFIFKLLSVFRLCLDWTLHVHLHVKSNRAAPTFKFWRWMFTPEATNANSRDTSAVFFRQLQWFETSRYSSLK